MHRKLATALVSISSGLLLQCLPASAITQVTPSDNAATTLCAIERHLFFHPYSNENLSSRLNRLEQFMFGASQPNRSDAERVQALSDAAQSLLQSHQQKAPRQSKDNSNQDVAVSPATASQRYSRVSDLEERVFAQTYETDSLKVRVSRLETKAFGHSFDDRDIALRVDDLDRCTSMPPVLGSSHSNSIYFQLPHARRNQPTRFISVVDHIEILEKSIYGKTFAEKTLQKRVADLEKSIIGSIDTAANDTITNRVATLWQRLSVTGSIKTQNG